MSVACRNLSAKVHDKASFGNSTGLLYFPVQTVKPGCFNNFHRHNRAVVAPSMNLQTQQWRIATSASSSGLKRRGTGCCFCKPGLQCWPPGAAATAPCSFNIADTTSEANFATCSTLFATPAAACTTSQQAWTGPSFIQPAATASAGSSRCCDACAVPATCKQQCGSQAANQACRHSPSRCHLELC